MQSRFYVMLLCTFFFLGHAEASEPARNEPKKHEPSVAQSSHVDEVLEVVKDKEIPTPVIQKPSSVTIWLRTFGISLVYKYHAVRDWFSKKLGRKS